MKEQLGTPGGAVDAELAAKIVAVEAKHGKLPEHVVGSIENLHEQAQLCAHGEHIYAWTGQIVDVPGGSPHQVMGCAFGAGHSEDAPKLRIVGPLHTSEAAAKHLWTREELQQAISDLEIDPNRDN